MTVFRTILMGPVTLTFRQGHVVMRIFLGLVIIHPHATFGADRPNICPRNVKILVKTKKNVT